MKSLIRRLFLIVVVLLTGGAIFLAMRPQPVPVDVVEIRRGPLVVTITDDGRTRIRERYVVSAPLSGRLVRIEFKPGDEVTANETLLTTIEPSDPSLLDPRSIAEAEARVKAAEARLQRARPRVDSARVALNHAETELGRLQQLAEKNASSQQSLEAQEVAYRQAGYDYDGAGVELEIAQFELEVAKAALTRSGQEEQPNDWSFPVRSPVSGRVLRVFQESATIVSAGDRILEIGDPSDLEVEVDVLSTSAVRVSPGHRVILEQWGGGQPLTGRVRLIEPSAFTKVSSLGIEEQRVNVIIDFTDLPKPPPPLGDGYRVEAAIVEWEAADVLTVPAGALFRDAEKWSVFVVRANRAELTHVELGHRNDDAAEVIQGLQVGDRVILYPGDRVEPDTTVVPRD